MSKNFGDILNAWDNLAGKPYRKKHIKHDERKNNKNNEKIKKVNEIEAWIRKYGVYDKDAETMAVKQEPFKIKKQLRKMPPEAEIDLHGMTRLEAEQALNVFFADCNKRKLKKILIIHGKGNHSKEEAVLLPFVKGYLEHQKLAGESGHPKNIDGGTGSTWVILKYR